MAGYPEYALNAFRTANAYLNVRLLKKPRIFINCITLDKHTSHRIDRRKNLILPDAMKHLDHRTIQIASETVFVIRWGFIAARVGVFQ